MPRGRAWLWAAFALGAAARLWLVLATPGSFDVRVKAVHGHMVNTHGLLGYYERSPLMNHPPPMGRFFAGVESLARASGLPFRACLRAPFALLDAATALVLLRLLRGARGRAGIVAAWWLHPLVWIFSAYHGNTDSAVAFFALLSLWGVAQGRPALAGAALGLGLWVKLPVLVAAPALCLALPRWRERALFAAVAAAVGLGGWLPELAQDPALLHARIVAYPGTGVRTPRGIAVWGLAHVLRAADLPLARVAERYNTFVCLTPIVLLAWLRRGRASPRELGATLAASFALLYGTTSFWAWQYLAWSLPFWCFVDPRLAALVTGLLAAYVWGVYALFTGSPLLLGRWDFVRHGPWPPLLTALRDASLLACLIFGASQLALAARRRPAAREAAG